MERPPRNVEYICLSCGSQGLAQVTSEDEDTSMRGNLSLTCPRCGGTVLCVEREVASHVALPVALEKH